MQFRLEFLDTAAATAYSLPPHILIKPEGESMQGSVGLPKRTHRGRLQQPKIGNLQSFRIQKLQP